MELPQLPGQQEGPEASGGGHQGSGYEDQIFNGMDIAASEQLPLYAKPLHILGGSIRHLAISSELLEYFRIGAAVIDPLRRLRSIN